MKLALDEAKIALDEGEMPVGAVITHRGTIVAKARDQRVVLLDPTAHAAILALTQAASALKSCFLADTTIYLTVEPTPMCLGALLESGVERLVFGTPNLLWGAAGTVLKLDRDIRLPRQIRVDEGVLAEPAQALLESYKIKRVKSGDSPE